MSDRRSETSGGRPGRAGRTGRVRGWAGSGRNHYLLVVVSLVVATVAAVPQVVRPPGARVIEATPAGLFSCSRGGDGGGEEPPPSDLDLVLDGLIASLTSGSNFFTFQGLVPAGVPVAPDPDEPAPVPDPATGGTLFTRSLGSARVGQGNGVDFLAPGPGGVPGAEGNELDLALVLRLAAGADGDDMGLRRLFNQNFGVPNEPGGDIGVLGVDVDLTANEALTALPPGFRGRFEGAFGFALPDGTAQAAGFRFEINSLADGRAIPEASSLSIVVRTRDEVPNGIHYALGQTARFAGFDGTANQPGVGFGLDLAFLEPGPDERDIIATDVAWDAAPRQAAFGFGQLCPTRGHIGWNLDPAGLPDPEAAGLDVDFRMGDQVGQLIIVDDGAGGSTEVRAPEVVLDGRITGLPSLMDFIMLNDALSFSRSAVVAPDVTLDRFHLAAEDPERDDELPLHVSGQLTDMPRHMLFVATEDPATGAIQRAELTGWSLDCPGEPTPPEPEAPENVRLPTRTDTLPSFPQDCARRGLVPLPGAEVRVQNWLPEDLDGRAAAAGLRPAPTDVGAGTGQYGYVATRAPNTLSSDGLLAFGARIAGLRRATVDLTRGTGTPNAARVYVERAPAPGGPAGDSARFVVDVDSSGAGQAGRGTRVATEATIDDLPDALRVDIGSLSPGQSPLDVTWRADAPIAISGGTLDFRNGGGAHFELHGAFELGAAGADPLPPAGRVQVTRNNSADQRNQVLYSAPDAPADGFPTPDVPDYDPNDRVRLHVGAELSQDEDRAAGVATRVHADLQVPQPIEVIWETTPDDRIKGVQAGYECDPGNQSQVTCQAGRYDIAVVRGPRGDLGPAALLSRPALPAPTGVVAQAVPAFTEFRPASGARAVVLGPDAWGAEALIGGLARFVYHREQSVLRVTLVDTAPQPFRLNLLDASRSAGSRRQVLFADAALDKLPRTVVVRQRDATADAEDPWLWINTEGDGIRDIDDVDWKTDPAGDRPRLTGVLRLGDALTLRDHLPSAGRPTPARQVRGADVWADYDDDNQLLSADAVVDLEVPRHVAVWRPTQKFCDGTTDDPEDCDYRPSYELDETNHVDARFRTTSARLGDLNLTGALRSGFHFEPCGLGCFRPAWSTHWTARARVADVPGRLWVRATIADNVRLPWLEVDVNIQANLSTDQVWAAIADENAEVEYREDGSPTVEQCTETTDQCTSRYAVLLDNVPANFRVTGRVQGYAEERLTPPPPSDEPPDPDEPETDLGGVGFVHAQLDLHGTTDRVFVDGREAADGQFVGSLRAERPDDNDDSDPEPGQVSGFVNARMEHVTVDLARRSAREAHPFKDFFIDAGGVVGLGVCVPLDEDAQADCEEVAPVLGGFGRFVVPYVLGIDIVVGTLLQIFFDADVTREFDLDMDLPVYVGFDRVDEIRLGQSGSTLSVDEHHTASGAAPATIAARQRSMAFEPALQVDGAFFHHRHVEFSYDPLIPQEDFDIGGDITNAMADVGLYRHDDCEEGARCYDVDRGSNVVTLDEVASPPDEARPGFDSADIMLDPLFSPDDREQFEDDDGGLVHPDDIFPRIAAASPPVPAEAFAPLPELSRDLVERRPGFFDQTTTCCFDALFQTNRPDNPPPILETFGATCAVSDPEEVLDGPRAVGSDGTEYVVVRKASNDVPLDRDHTLCDATQLLLEAHFPGPGNDLGAPRWTIALPLPAGFEDRPGRDDDGACRREEDVRCEIEVRVAPQAGGSVHVEMTTRVVADGTDSRAQDYQVTMNPDSWAQPLFRLRDVLRFGCCGEPEVITHASSALDPVFAWVDASGHPGFHRGEAVRVDDLDEVIVPIDQATGIADLDPCEIAPDFGCGGLPAGHTTQWLFGDGGITEPVGGRPASRTHRYARGTPNPDIFLGMLVHYDEDGEVVETAQFRPAGA